MTFGLRPNLRSFAVQNSQRRCWGMTFGLRPNLRSFAVQNSRTGTFGLRSNLQNFSGQNSLKNTHLLVGIFYFRLNVLYQPREGFFKFNSVPVRLVIQGSLHGLNYKVGTKGSGINQGLTSA